MSENEKCVLCCSVDCRVISETLRHNTPGKIVECTHCGLRRKYGAILEEAEGFYREEYSKAYFQNEKANVDSLYETFYPLQEKRFQKISQYFNSTSRVLEIGSGPGYFLKSIEDKVGSTLGVELNTIWSHYANTEKDVQTLNSDFKECDLEEEFDVVCLFQVLEHMPDPVSEINAIFSLLKKGGYLIIEVPNLQNPLVSFFKNKNFIDFWHQSPHLYYFSQETLSNLINKTNFSEVINVFSVQEVGFVNHVNWYLTGAPMRNRLLCVNDNKLLYEDGPDNKKASQAFMDLYDDFNSRYKQLMEEHSFGDHLVIVAQK